MIVDLTEAEIAVLSMELEHSPDCAWSSAATIFVTTSDGRNWTDATCTVPYVKPECTCGYFGLMYAARDKLRAVR